MPDGCGGVGGSVDMSWNEDRRGETLNAIWLFEREVRDWVAYIPRDAIHHGYCM